MNDRATNNPQARVRLFDEKAYRRPHLALWDSRWHRLSASARHFLLQHFSIPDVRPNFKILVIDVSPSSIPPDICGELAAEGFVPGGPSRRLLADLEEGLYDFAARAQTLVNYHLLAIDRPSEFIRYVGHAFHRDELEKALEPIIRRSGIGGVNQLLDQIDRFVTRGSWPETVTTSMNEPLGERILEVIRKAGGPVSMGALLGSIEGSAPDKVRKVVDHLVSRLVLVEDFQADSWDLMIGFLPSVRAELAIARGPRDRPPLVKCENLKQIGPDGSPVLNDVRGVMLELASQPPRLRQDQCLFHKEVERFRAALDPLDGWLLSAMKWSNEGRINRAIAWARLLQLAAVEMDENQARLHLSPKGQTWLSGSDSEDHAELYRALGRTENKYELTWPELGLYLPGLDPYQISGTADMAFLGTHVTAVKSDKGRGLSYYSKATTNDHLALRARMDTALSVLEPGTFYPLDSIESHLVHDEHNPLNLGLPAEQVAVYWLNRPVVDRRAEREGVARQVIRAFVLERLVPFGAVRAAVDNEGRICIAREARYDGYFGRKIAEPHIAPSADAASRVVVQPDFSVVVIGVNPARAALLAPFCERTTRGGGQGAMVLKITRESVVRAVSNGLKPADIVARLERNSSNAVPGNVLRQVQEWSAWVRTVESSSLMVLRCPDSDTADRVVATMKRQALRVNSILVAFDQKKLTTADRNKLRDHGILVDEVSEAEETRSKGRDK